MGARFTLSDEDKPLHRPRLDEFRHGIKRTGAVKVEGGSSERPDF
jgi:hypothetical protein